MSNKISYSRSEIYNNISIPFYSIYNVVDSLTIRGYENLYRHGYVKIKFDNATFKIDFSNKCYKTFLKEVDEVLNILKNNRNNINDFDLMFFAGSVAIHLTLKDRKDYYFNFKTNNENHFKIISSYTFDVLDERKKEKEKIRCKVKRYCSYGPFVMVFVGVVLSALLALLLKINIFVIFFGVFLFLLFSLIFVDDTMLYNFFVPKHVGLETTNDEKDAEKSKRDEPLIEQNTADIFVMMTTIREGFGSRAKTQKRY